MFKKIFKKEKEVINDKIIILVAALLIHAAKIDENYTPKEKELIKKALLELGAEQKNINSIMNNAENNEANSNQILEFTKEVKNLSEEEKIKIVETLWTIIFSDNQTDMYESNLMRRLTGLLYLDKKLVGNLKEKVKSKLIK